LPRVKCRPVRDTLAVLVVAAVLAPASDALAVSDPPAKLAAGATFAVKDPGKRGTVRLVLSRDTRLDLADVVLTGGIPGGRAAKAVVPASAPPGVYRLLSCAGSKCSAAKRPATIFTATRDASRPFTPDDVAPLPTTDAQLLAQAASTRPCPPAAGGSVPSLTAALRDVRRVLTSAAGKSGVARLDRSPALATGPRAEETAVRAVMTGEPGAAIDSLLAAQREEPNDPGHLINAAALLATTGHPLDAIALVRAADALPPRRSAPFGIGSQALARNAEGIANLALGRFAEAERQLRAAVALEPVLAEAKLNLGTALRCRKQAEAARWLRAGRYRQPIDAVVGPGDPIVNGFPPVEVFDLGAGKTVEMPAFKLPATVNDAAALRDTYFAMERDYNTRFVARNQRINQLRAGVKFPNELSSRRARDVTTAIGLVSTSPGLNELGLKIVSEELAINRYSDDWWGTGQRIYERYKPWRDGATAACRSSNDSGCYQREYLARCSGPTEQAHSGWLALMQNYVRDQAEFVRLYSRQATGLAANLADPALYEAAMLDIEQTIAMRANYVTTQAGFWAGPLRNSGCWGDAPAPEAPTDGRDAAPERSAPCPPFLKGVKFGFKVGKDPKMGLPFDLAVDVNCEKVSIEIGAKVVGKDNYLGVFGQFDYAPGTGKVTLFGGPKASGKIPGTPLGGSIKDGLYVRFNRDGSLDDAGFRVSPGVQAGAGPFTIKGGDSMDFAFAPVF
jgi:tetratricopeptide (TPR) repeat protein